VEVRLCAFTDAEFVSAKPIFDGMTGI
jgi:hypothetical protein